MRAVLTCLVRKHIFVFMVMAFIFPGMACPLSAEEVLIDRAVLENILRRQDALEKEVGQLKEQLKKTEATTPEVFPSVVQEDIEYLKEDAEEISQRLDAVETKSILDKIQIGGEFRTRLNFYNYHRMEDDMGHKKDGRTDELWSGRLRLSLRSDITDNLIFQGRLTYYKFWGDTNYDGMSNGFSDLYHPGVPKQEGNLHVERAYVDYFVPETPLSITFGRMPTGNGPPYEFKNNTTRKATWPMLCHDGELDGIMTNLSLENWTGWKNSFFRLGYYKLSQNYQQYQGVDIDSSRVGIVAFETEIPGLKDSIFWISADRLFDIGPFEHPAASSYPSDFGHMDKLNLHIQFNNIKNSGLGCFASYVYERIRPRKAGTIFPPEVTGLPFDYEAGFLGDNLTNSLGKDRSGHAVYAGLKYTFPSEKLNHPQLGFEYVHGSEYWMPGPTGGNDDFLNKLSVNGDAYEVYYIQPIHEKHMFCRIGIVYMDYDYIMNYYGPSTESDTSVFHTYFLTDVRF